MNKKTLQGLDSFYRTSQNEILTCQMETLSTKENTSNSLTTGEEINSNAEENFSDLTDSQTRPNGAQKINETYPPSWKYEAKISALKSYVQCKLSALHKKIDCFNKTFQPLIRLFQTLKTKPYEILQDNIEFLQNELRSKDEIKTLVETQTAVLENLPLSKPPQQTESNTSFKRDVNQLNKNIFFKGQVNQKYNSQSQHHVVNIQYQKSSKQQNRNHSQNSKQEKRLYIGNLDKDVKEEDLIELFGFSATTYLQENCRVDLPTGKNKDWICS